MQTTIIDETSENSTLQHIKCLSLVFNSSDTLLASWSNIGQSSYKSTLLIPFEPIYVQAQMGTLDLEDEVLHGQQAFLKLFQWSSGTSMSALNPLALFARVIKMR